MRTRSFGMTLLLLNVLVLLVVSNPTVALAQDVEGSKDHPVISRNPSSIITKYRVKEFDEYILPLGKLIL